jgi:hypothetical protein
VATRRPLLSTVVDGRSMDLGRPVEVSLGALVVCSGVELSMTSAGVVCVGVGEGAGVGMSLELVTVLHPMTEPVADLVT